MTRSSDLSELLSQKPIVLVVEDMVAKEYLLHAWASEQIFFTVITAGSHNVVKGVVEDLRKHSGSNKQALSRVFGLIDLDFGTPNIHNWNDQINAPSVLRGEHHEVENYLLDWDALAGCDINQLWHKHNATDIQQWAEAEAAKQVYWLACRKVLREVRCAICTDFPGDPAVQNIATIDDAEKYICSHTWIQTLKSRAADAVERPRIHADLEASATVYQAALVDGSWRKIFPGKEIYRHLLSRIYDVPKTQTANADVDLAISIAKWQDENSRVPQEVRAIADALKRRVNI